MDGMLSQEEINALFSNMDDTPAGSSGPTETKADGKGASSSGQNIVGDILTDIEKDAIGEISNISMGTAATTLNALVNQPVNITTPTVSYGLWDTLSNDFQDRPCVALQLGYKEGLNGNNILVLKEHDVLVITDLMMGGDGTSVSGELGELHLSAISEAMNQMMGSSSTSLASMIGKKIDILPPIAKVITFDDNSLEMSGSDFRMDEFVKVSFKMTIGDLVDSEIMQLYPLDFAKKLYEMFSGSDDSESSTASQASPAPASQTSQASQSAAPSQMDQQMMNNQMMNNQMMNGQMMNGQMMNGQMMNNQMMNGQMMNGQMMNNQMMDGQMMNGQMPYGQMPYQQMPYQQMPYQQMPYGQMPYGQMPYGMQEAQPGVNVQMAQFQAFSNNISPAQQKENIDLIMDVPLEVTVELGKTTKSIKDILEFSPGTIIELNKIAGEPIDVMVNGKYVAKGEVVVIEDSFAVRVT